MNKKICRKCGELKLFSEFYNNRSREDGMSEWCKACSKASRQRVKERNRSVVTGNNGFSVNDLTFGVEIEGLFSGRLASKIRRQQPRAEIKYDGSVRFSYNVEDQARQNFAGGLANAREIATEVMDYNKTKKFLDLFDETNYRFNETTGLHIHIGTTDRRNMKKLQAMVCNYKFIRSLQKMAKRDYCECQTSRSTGNQHYFRDYTNSDRLIREYKMEEKYRFCRFHPSGTIEFRFLRPCNHRTENVKKLIKEVLKYLNQKNERAINIPTPSREISVDISEEANAPFIPTFEL